MATTVKSSPPQQVQQTPTRGPRLRRVPDRLSSLRDCTTVTGESYYRDNDFQTTPRHTPLPGPCLTPSETYQHLLSLQTNRYGPSPLHHERVNRFDRSQCSSPTSVPDLEVDENPQNFNMEQVRARILADFRAGVVGSHYNFYEEDEVDTEFEEDTQQPPTVSAQFSIDTKLNNGGSRQSNSPVDSLLTPLDKSISSHDWAEHPALRKAPEAAKVETVPDSPQYDDDVDCNCCGYDIDDNHNSVQSQVVPFIMAGDSGYMSARDGPETHTPGPQYTPNRTTRQFQSPRSPKRRMAISDILCDPPSKRPKSIDQKLDDEDQTATSANETPHPRAPPSSPAQGAGCFGDRNAKALTLPNPLDRCGTIEEWVMLSRLEADSPECGDIVIACDSSLSFIDEVEARRLMLENWDRQLEEDFEREVKKLPTRHEC